MNDLIVRHAFDFALLTAGAIIGSPIVAWLVDRVWRRKYLRVKRRLNVLTGRPMDFYRRDEKAVTFRDVAGNNTIARRRTV